MPSRDLSDRPVSATDLHMFFGGSQQLFESVDIYDIVSAERL